MVVHNRSYPRQQHVTIFKIEKWREIMKTEEKRKDGKDVKNPNHPKKGSRITVDPIRRLEDIKAIKSILSDKPRDLLLFAMGVNSGLRAGDLLRLKVKDVRHLEKEKPPFLFLPLIA